MLGINSIMSTDVVTLSPEDTLADARALMWEHRIHHLPVVDDSDKLIGLVTLTDVLAASDSRLRDRQSQMRARDISVRDFMVSEIATVGPQASLRQAALFLEKHKIGCLPVVEAGCLIGIITDTDFVAVAINLLEQLEESEPFEEEDADAA